MSMLKAAPRILVAIAKHRIQLAVGEQAFQGVADAVADTLGEEMQAKIDHWLGDNQTRKAIDKAADKADDCFRQTYGAKRPDLVEVLLGMALAGSPDITAAIQPYDRPKLLTAIKTVLEQNLPKLAVQTRAAAAKKYLDCLEDALVSIDDLTNQIIASTVREMRPRIEAIQRTTSRIDRTTKNIDATTQQTAEGVKELLRRGAKPDGQTAVYQPDPLPDPDSIPDRGPLPPGSNLRILPNANFVGRQADLKAMADCLLHHSGGKVMAVTAAMGAGGIGKTQLAIEFAYRYGRFFNGVHWLSAISDRLEPEIAACGVAMQLPNFPDTQDAQIDYVLGEWATSAPRLIIVDNAEKPDVVQEWLPRLQGQRVLITTRRRELPAHWGVVARRLDVLMPDESRELLRRLAPHLDKATDAELDAIGAKLGYLPLALDLAGNYIRLRHLAPTAYLTQLEQQKSLVDHRLFTTWAQEAGVVSPTDHDLSVYATFDLSWQRLTSDAPKRVLIGCSYLAPNTPIPLELLTALFKGADDPAEALDMALAKLEEVGLLSRKDDGRPVIHLLIAEFARLQVGAGDDALAVLADKLATMSYAANETGIPANFAPLRAHSERLAQQAESAKNEDAGALWNNLAFHYNMLADYKGARGAYENVLRILPEDNPNYGTAVNNLGLVLQALGDFPLAKTYLERALRIDEATYGPDHPKVAIDVNNLGNVLQDTGDLAGARVMYERALRIDEATYGPDHPKVATRVNNLGTVLKDLGDLPLAKAYYERALHIDEQAYGPDHPKVAIRVNNLGNVLQDLGDLTGAKAYYERALRMGETTFGPDHPNVAIRVNNLGNVLQDLGDLTGAKVHYERALRIFEGTLGENHPQVAIGVNNLGTLAYAMGDLVAARACFERALRIRKRFLPENHPYIQTSQEWLDIVNEELAGGA